MAVDKSIYEELWATPTEPETELVPITLPNPDEEPLPVKQEPSVYEALWKDHDQQLGLNAQAVVDNVGETPEQTGDIVRTADKLGLDVDVVRRNLDVFKGMARATSMSAPDYAQLASKNPRLAVMLTDRDTASLMQDKIPVWQRTAASMAAFTEDRSLPWSVSLADSARSTQLGTLRAFGSIPAVVLAPIIGADSAALDWWYNTHNYIQSELKVGQTFEKTLGQDIAGAGVSLLVDPLNVALPGAGAAIGRAAATATESATVALAKRMFASGVKPAAQEAVVGTTGMTAKEIASSLTGASMAVFGQTVILDSATVNADTAEKAKNQGDPNSHLSATQTAWILLDSAFQGLTTKFGGFIGVLAGRGPHAGGAVSQVAESVALNVAQGEVSYLALANAQDQELNARGALVAGVGGALGGAAFALPNAIQTFNQRAQIIVEDGTAAAESVSKAQTLITLAQVSFNRLALLIHVLSLS
jgi:hypothetical protein